MRVCFRDICQVFRDSLTQSIFHHLREWRSCALILKHHRLSYIIFTGMDRAPVPCIIADRPLFLDGWLGATSDAFSLLQDVLKSRSESSCQVTTLASTLNIGL